MAGAWNNFVNRLPTPIKYLVKGIDIAVQCILILAGLFIFITLLLIVLIYIMIFIVYIVMGIASLLGFIE